MYQSQFAFKSLVPLVFFHKLEKLDVRFESEIFHEAIDFTVAVFWMAILDPFDVFYQVQFAIKCITKKT